MEMRLWHGHITERHTKYTYSKQADDGLRGSFAPGGSSGGYDGGYSSSCTTKPRPWACLHKWRDVVSIRIRTVHNASHGIVKDVSQSAVQESNRSTACCSPNRHDLFVSVGFSHVFLLISFAQSASAKLPSDQLRSVGFGKMFWVHLFVSLSLLRQLVSLRMLRPRVSLGTAHGRTRSFTEDDQVR